MHIRIRLTQQNIDAGQLDISGPIRGGFFPSASLGPLRQRPGRGRPLRLEIDGVAGEILTDIPRERQPGKPRRFFREHGWVREFLSVHGLRAGDEVVIEQLGPDHYRVFAALAPQPTEADRGPVPKEESPKRGEHGHLSERGPRWALLGGLAFVLAAPLVFFLSVNRGIQISVAFLPLAVWLFGLGWAWRDRWFGKSMEAASTTILFGIIVTVALDLWVLPYARVVQVSATDHLRNGDLVHAVSDAVGWIIGEHAEHIGDPPRAKVLARWQREAPVVWFKLMKPLAPDRPHELAGLQEEQLIDFVRHPQKAALNDASWRTFLGRFASESEMNDEELIAPLVERLQRQFGHALSVVTRDNHRAEVALNWLTAGEYLRLQDRTAAGIEAVSSLSGSTHTMVSKLLGVENAESAESALRDVDAVQLVDLARIRVTELVKQKDPGKIALEVPTDTERLADVLWHHAEGDLADKTPVPSDVMRDAYLSLWLNFHSLVQRERTDSERLDRYERLIKRLEQVARVPNQIVAHLALAWLDKHLPGQLPRREARLRALAADQSQSALTRWKAMTWLIKDRPSGTQARTAEEEVEDIKAAVLIAPEVSDHAVDEARTWLAAAYLRAGNPVQSQMVQRERLGSLPAGDPGRAHALAAIADIEEKAGRLDALLVLRGEQLRAALSAGNASDIVSAHIAKAKALEMLNRGEEARAEERRAVYTSLGYGLNARAVDLAKGLIFQASFARSKALLDHRAVVVYEPTTRLILDQVRQIGDAEDVALVLIELAEQEEAAGAPDKAGNLLAEASELLERAGLMSEAGDAHNRRASLYAKNGRANEAISLLRRAAAMATPRRWVPNAFQTPHEDLIRLFLANHQPAMAFDVYAICQSQIASDWSFRAPLTEAATAAGRTDIIELLQSNEERDRRTWEQSENRRGLMAQLHNAVKEGKWEVVAKQLPALLASEAEHESLYWWSDLVTELLAARREDLVLDISEWLVSEHPESEAAARQVESWLRERLDYRGRAESGPHALRLKRLFEHCNRVHPRTNSSMTFYADIFNPSEQAAARQTLTQRIAIARSRGNRATLADALCRLGECCNRQGDLEAAEAALVEALPIVELRSPTEAARCCETLGDIHREAGRLGRATSDYERALALFRMDASSGDCESLVDKLGSLLETRGLNERAESVYEDGLSPGGTLQPTQIRLAALIGRTKGAESATPLWNALRLKFEPAGLSWMVDVMKDQPAVLKAMLGASR